LNLQISDRNPKTFSKLFSLVTKANLKQLHLLTRDSKKEAEQKF